MRWSWLICFWCASCHCQFDSLWKWITKCWRHFYPRIFRSLIRRPGRFLCGEKDWPVFSRNPVCEKTEKYHTKSQQNDSQLWKLRGLFRTFFTRHTERHSSDVGCCWIQQLQVFGFRCPGLPSMVRCTRRHHSGYWNHVIIRQDYA